jgi:hypothetical protein
MADDQGYSSAYRARCARIADALDAVAAPLAAIRNEAGEAEALRAQLAAQEQENAALHVRLAARNSSEVTHEA